VTTAVTRRLAQAGRLTRDAVGVVTALARAVLWTVRGAVGEPGLAMLSGAPLVRVGEPAAYRIRAYNGAAVRRPLELSVAGWLDGEMGTPFQLTWTVLLDPGQAEERWIQTDWHGRAALVTSAPDQPAIWDAGAEIGRWHVEARARGAKRTPVLHVSGSVVR
jgi:hypothetical protein